MFYMALARGRAVLQARGHQSLSLLQALSTNDMLHLERGSDCLYTMFLNARGRTLFDSIIYADRQTDTFYIDCDRVHLQTLQKHLNMYRLKRDVQINAADKDVWLLYDDSLSNTSDELSKIPENDPRIYIDPRLKSLGMRILSSETSITNVIKNLNLKNIKEVDDDLYKMFRYKLGVSEGGEEIISGNSFPLEANCDYLHGVSFHKGCYIGQELTARTHHTGVVRKRIMPLIFDEDITGKIPNDTPIYSSDNAKTAIGKIRGVIKNVGIGLLRINEVLAAPSLKVLDFNAKTFKPNWWPVEAPKEKIN